MSSSLCHIKLKNLGKNIIIYIFSVDISKFNLRLTRTNNCIFPKLSPADLSQYEKPI